MKPQEIPSAALELQRIDTNCNDCAHLQRMFGPDAIAITNEAGSATGFYGGCLKKQRRIAFMPGINMLENAACFRHRKDQQEP